MKFLDVAPLSPFDMDPSPILILILVIGLFLLAGGITVLVIFGVKAAKKKRAQTNLDGNSSNNSNTSK